MKQLWQPLRQLKRPLPLTVLLLPRLQRPHQLQARQGRAVSEWPHHHQRLQRPHQVLLMTRTLQHLLQMLRLSARPWSAAWLGCRGA
jgi:hypothetical protein